MEPNYDENLTENPFLQYLQHDNNTEIFTKAVKNHWIICVPRQGSYNDDFSMDKKIISQHILISNNIDDDELANVKTGSSFRTLSGDQVTLKDRHLTLHYQDEDEHKTRASRLLFEETFYTDNLAKYIVWCIECPLSHDLLNQNVKNDVVSVTTLADCVGILWSDIQDSDVFRHLDLAIESFEQMHKSIDTESPNAYRQLVEKLYQDCLNKILNCEKVREKISTNSHYLRTIKLSIESYILYGLRNLLPAAVSTHTSVQDAKLNKIIKNLHELELKDLDIRYDIQTACGLGKMELSRLDSYMTVLGKVECLKRAVRYISQSLDTISSDDLLPILIFIVVKTGLPNWIAQLQFMKQFRFSVDAGDDAGEVEFLIASLEAAVEHVRSGVLKENNFKMTIGKIPEESQENSKNFKINELFKLIEKDDVDGVEKILNQQATKRLSSTIIDSKLCHPLCRCENCERSFSEIQLTASSWPSVNTKDERGRTALHIASLCGNVVIVDFLLTHSANPNEHDIDGITPLQCATSRGHQNTVLLLLQADADPQLLDNRGNGPLHLAADHGHEACIKAILYFTEQVGIVLNTSCQNVIGDTPLHYASKWGYISIVDILLEHGANSRIANRRGQTPMTIAHNIYVFRKLEKQQINPVETILKIPRRQSIVSKLVNGCKNSSDHSDTTYKTEKLLAAIREGDIRLACYYLGLEGPCARLNADDVSSRLCHPLCVCDKCASTAEDTLDEYNPSSPLGINVSNLRGETALHVASTNGLVDLVEILLDAGANVNICTNSDKRTPLHVACLNSRIKVVKLLLNCRTINVNIKDYAGNTPLHLTAKNGDSHIIELLLRHGADVNCRNFKGATALDQVQENLSDNSFTPCIYSNVIKILKAHVETDKTSHLDNF